MCKSASNWKILKIVLCVILHDLRLRTTFLSYASNRWRCYKSICKHGNFVYCALLQSNIWTKKSIVIRYNVIQPLQTQDKTNSEAMHVEECAHVNTSNNIIFRLCADFLTKTKFAYRPSQFSGQKGKQTFHFLGQTVNVVTMTYLPDNFKMDSLFIKLDHLKLFCVKSRATLLNSSRGAGCLFIVKLL